MVNEKRLIDAKALEKQIKQAFEDTNPYAMGMMLRWVRKQTKVDAVEVVHGRWHEVDGETEWECHYRCSKCFTRSYELTNYCPNCGADMRERKDNV